MITSSQRILFTLLAIVSLAAVAPARAQEFGHSFLDGAASSGMTGDFKRGSRFALPSPGVLNMLEAFMDGFGGPQTGYQSVSMVLYQDVNGLPGVKVAESDPIRVEAQAIGHWYEFYMPPIALPAGNYWIVIHTGGASDGSTPGIARNFGSSNRQPPNWYGNADSYADGASSPFGTGASGTVELEVFATYLPAHLARSAGRNTIAATPSGGLTSNFKRGSRFTLSESGRVFALSAYLDGKGGASGTQKVRYALYTDASGVPGTRIVESDEVTVKAGHAGSWMSASVPQTDLAPGNYWIVIHSGDSNGVARDYGDGASNFYSNADAYSDGASSSFGAGNAGTVTLSANAMYIPGPVQMRTLGRTTIAVTPSKGLTANFSRGGKFGAFDVSNTGVVTALWAYLDGNGGGSGSQQLRAAYYVDAQVRDTPEVKMYETEVVTIPAGLSPRWVRFPLKAPVAIESNPGYWIMLQSGDTTGVARDYGDGRANWVGFADAFADGPTPAFDPNDSPDVTQGTVELSMYIEYVVPATTP